MKIKDLIKELKKYDPDLNVRLGMKAEIETKKNEASSYDYLYSDYKLEVTDDTPAILRKKKCIYICGELEEQWTI